MSYVKAGSNTISMVKVQLRNPGGAAKSNKYLRTVVLIGAVILALNGILLFNSDYKNDYDDYRVDETCTSLPTVRPSGSYFLDSKIKAGKSPDDVTPSFQVGSLYAEKVPYHMATESANYRFMKDLLLTHNSIHGLALDIGANQGFWTYYMATLGLTIHAFEINEANFRSLQHGAEFNPKAVSDRVHLYPIGLGEKNGRFGMQGNNYEGFLKEAKDAADAPIMGMSFDCFAEHMRGKVDLTNIAFLKLDVEGFETAVLKGFHNSLYKYSKIGGMIMEVGPKRWGRANVDFDTGFREMKLLAEQFQSSYILLRTKGGYASTCPLSLAEGILSDKTPEEVDGTHKYAIKKNELKPLLSKMEQDALDCNFFYVN